MIKFIDNNWEYVPISICYISGGGGSQQSAQSSQSTGGFQALSDQIKGAYNDLATTAQSYIPGTNIGGATSAMFTPLQQTAGETTAINNVNKGFAPTPQNLQSNIALQTNPFDQSVIDGINREAQGQGSILKQAATQAGQFGSNRFALGANDIDLSRLQQIGQFKQGNYNTALQNSLTTIPQQQLSDANAQLSAGSFQRSLAGQTSQAPLSSLQQLAQILGILPTNSSQSSSQGSSSGGQFNFGLGGINQK